MENNWRRRELAFLIVYAIAFYAFLIRRSLQLSHDYYTKLYGLLPGWIASRLNANCFSYMLCIFTLSFLVCDHVYEGINSPVSGNSGLSWMTFVVPLDGIFVLTNERSVQDDKFSFAVYLCYLIYAPLYIAGPMISFNALALQLDTPQKNYSSKQVAWCGLCWYYVFS